MSPTKYDIVMTNHSSLSFLLVLLAAPVAVNAQSVSLGADFVNRYVWRGFDFGESFSVQPSLAVTGGNFEIGSWASYSISADGAGANEHDLWLSYHMESENAGALSIGLTDYYFPAPDGSDFFNFDSDGDGSHWLEPYVSYTPPGSFPLTIYAAAMVHNDPDNSLYLEGSLPFSLGETSMNATFGMVAGASDFYAVESASIINMGISAEKELKISDSFSLPVSAAYILNPTHERTFLVFGFSLSL